MQPDAATKITLYTLLSSFLTQNKVAIKEPANMTFVEDSTSDGEVRIVSPVKNMIIPRAVRNRALRNAVYSGLMSRMIIMVM